MHTLYTLYHLTYSIYMCTYRMAPEVVVCETDKDNPYDAKVIRLCYCYSNKPCAV